MWSLSSDAKQLIAIVAGTRPECVKTASIVRAFAAHADIDVRLINSGQHGPLVEQTFAHLGLRTDVALPPPAPGRSLSRTVHALRSSLEQSFRELHPAIAVVQGDTSTAYAGALAARTLDVPLAHVEAGLRTANPRRPFPEEPFRRRIAPLAQWHFAPTVGAADNLIREGTPETQVMVVGNTGVDELRLALEMPVAEPLDGSMDDRRTITLTLHRRENYGRGLDIVCDAVLALLAARSDLRIVCPVHPNPTVGTRIRRRLGGHAHIELTEPIPYRSFVRLLRRSALVLTDSGGIQEEAPYLGVPVIVVRDATERPEALGTGNTQLVPLDRDTIVRATQAALARPRPAAVPFTLDAPFGDGHSGRRIADTLAAALHDSPRRTERLRRIRRRA